MSKSKINFAFPAALLVFVSLACNVNKQDNGMTINVNSNSTTAASNTNARNADADTADDIADDIADDETASTSGAERQKPAAGKGGVQGKVLFNDEPVEGIEIRICEKFSTILGVQCDGEKRTTKTGKDGVFVLADLEPKTYGGLTAKVFNTAYYVFPQEGIMTAQRFPVQADKTIFARDIHLFKDDIKIINPKAGAKVDSKNLEIKWDAYPNAAYYKITLYPEAGGLATVSGERVDDPSYTVSEPLANGKYRLQVEAYNAKNHKLAESDDDIKFTATGGAEPAPAK